MQHGACLCSTPEWGKDCKVPKSHQHKTQIQHLMLRQGWDPLVSCFLQHIQCFSPLLVFGCRGKDELRLSLIQHAAKAFTCANDNICLPNEPHTSNLPSSPSE